MWRQIRHVRPSTASEAHAWSASKSHSRALKNPSARSGLARLSSGGALVPPLCCL